jgi:putative PIN family toxin of toxin-antitoxin system
MRLVLDTNVAVAGLLWHGAPRRLIDAAIDDESVTLYSSSVLIGELANTLAYAKFAKRIAQFETNSAALVAQYEALVTLVSPTHTPRVVADDPDDDHVIACAVAANAKSIVSGDKHLLSIKSYQNIAILSPADALHVIEANR